MLAVTVSDGSARRVRFPEAASGSRFRASNRYRTMPYNPEGLEVGDVVLDLAQGRPMQIVGRYDGTAEEWSEENDYELLENYGNSRFDSRAQDAVFDCVYVGSIKSEPSKTYAFPVARLRRIEVEESEEALRRVGTEIRQRFFVDLIVETGMFDPKDPEVILNDLAAAAEEVLGPKAYDEAKELAEIESEGAEAEPELGDFDA